tara:strand:- start:828 stop:1316 length:489 start_codon:yes stop_codon:yes gene_type:complete
MFKIKKNIIKKEKVKEINNMVLNDYFPWYAQNKINDLDKTGYGYFTHSLYLNKKINSEFFKIIMPEILDNLKIKSLLRARLNLYPKTTKNIRHAFHIDYKFKHMSAVYFLNTNNGFLFFKNPSKKIKPEANKCVIFNGEHSHSSSSCTDKTNRITLNINYEL